MPDPTTPAPAPAPAPGPAADGWEVASRRPPTTMWRAAVRPRMVALLLLLLGAAFVCGRLGVWQLDRAQIRGAGAQERHVAEQLAADPVPILDVLRPQTPFEGADVARKVSVEGTYDASGQLVVPDRAHDGRTGYLVLTPLRAREGVLPVVRGWVAQPDDADVPPAGPVSVEGFLQASEGSGAEIADGRTEAISSAQLVGQWGGPIWTGYLVLSSSDPAQSDEVALLGLPTKPGEGLNLQNLAYAAQWWIFGTFAVLLWLRLVRDEARGDGLGDARDDGRDEAVPDADGARPA
ncbi:SURF1 family protein [Cellulomonas edaphi]|uniref:SURF1-like protein n=1 Tax=Cellulomonas edaphi TaxID=3053468 RepID=A0ABT7S8P4_9CELL|nr:SURF1 family protein [Cellulomons edaphi]MDM7831951.1 SURF1 family protein [Cellulomons edaphi]